MSRFTIRNLRELVAEANERYPRETPNWHGNLDRFGIEQAYGGYQVIEYNAENSGVRSITYGHPSARECAEKFRRYLWERY